MHLTAVAMTHIFQRCFHYMGDNRPDTVGETDHRLLFAVIVGLFFILYVWLHVCAH